MDTIIYSAYKFEADVGCLQDKFPVGFIFSN